MSTNKSSWFDFDYEFWKWPFFSQYQTTAHVLWWAACRDKYSIAGVYAVEIAKDVLEDTLTEVLPSSLLRNAGKGTLCAVTDISKLELYRRSELGQVIFKQQQ